MAKPLYEKAYTLGKHNNDPNVGIYKANFDRVSEKVRTPDAAIKKQ